MLSVQTAQPDTLFLLKDAAIVQFEFQMKRNTDDLERFYRTQFAVAEHYQCRVHTVVLYAPDVLEAPDTLDRGSAVFRVRNVHIGSPSAALERRIAADDEPALASILDRLTSASRPEELLGD